MQVVTVLGQIQPPSQHKHDGLEEPREGEYYGEANGYQHADGSAPGYVQGIADTDIDPGQRPEEGQHIEHHPPSPAGEPDSGGGGKSNRAKLSALELILRGARIVAFEPDTIAEWAKALRSVPGARFIDPTVGRWCFDPLVICHPHEAARLAAAHILPWIGVSADSLTAKRYRRLLRPDNRTRNGIRNHRELMNYLRAQPDHEHDELLLRLETAEEDFPGFFDPRLPPYRPYDAPATVYLTGNLALPDAEDIANEQLYLKLSGPQRAGMAIYGLLIDIERQYMFDHPDRFDVMIFEECAQLLAYPAGARTAHLITRRGRKHATGIWFITQDFRDLARMGDKFVTQKWIFRIQAPELAYLTLQWARIDPDMYPELVVTLCDDTSPGNTRDEDILDDFEGSQTSVAEAGAVHTPELVDWYNDSFYGQITRMEPSDPFPDYMPPPLDGIWATAPYLHNGSVPTVELVLNSAARPTYWRRIDYDSTHFDEQALGWPWFATDTPQSQASEAVAKFLYDTTWWSQSNRGHTFGDHLSDAERRAVIEYLKTL